MNSRDYAISVALSAAAGLMLMFFIWLLSLVSWILVWAAFVFVFIPLNMKLIKFWRDTDCKDLSDLQIEIDNHFKERKKKKSFIDNDINNIDW